MRKRTVDALIEMGVPANLSGFHYICDAMELYAQDESYILSGTTVLYKKIAEMHGTAWTRVERCIRHAFEKATTYGNLYALNKYMTAAQKPTNGNLLACLYMKVKDWGKENEMSPRAATRKAQTSVIGN